MRRISAAGVANSPARLIQASDQRGQADNPQQLQNRPIGVMSPKPAVSLVLAIADTVGRAEAS